MVSSIETQSARQVVEGLRQVGLRMAERTIPTDYPHGDRLSTELGNLLRELVSLETRVAGLIFADVGELEATLHTTLQEALTADYFPSQEFGSPVRPGSH
jgi:hypothetical protein